MHLPLHCGLSNRGRLSLLVGHAGTTKRQTMSGLKPNKEQSKLNNQNKKTMAIQFEPQQEQPQQEKTYKVGDTFLYKNKDPYMIVVYGESSVILSSLTDGRRWGNAVKVADYGGITQSELDKLMGSSSSDFTQRDFKLIVI